MTIDSLRSFQIVGSAYGTTHHQQVHTEETACSCIKSLLAVINGWNITIGGINLTIARVSVYTIVMECNDWFLKKTARLVLL